MSEYSLNALPPLQAAIWRWEYEGGALSTRPLTGFGLKADVAQAVNTELEHLHIRLIAMENLLVALLAQNPDGVSEMGAEMIRFISPRPGFTRHPRTLGAAAQILNVVERAQFFRKWLDSGHFKNTSVAESKSESKSEPIHSKPPADPEQMAALNSACLDNNSNISALSHEMELDDNGQAMKFGTVSADRATAYKVLRCDPDATSLAVYLPAQHESCLFLLNDNNVLPLAHDRYVALARGEAYAAEFARSRFILVDWYLDFSCGHPASIVNETCSWLVFNAQGLLDFHAAHAIDAPAVPTKDQWAKLRALVFGDAFGALGADVNQE